MKNALILIFAIAGLAGLVWWAGADDRELDANDLTASEQRLGNAERQHAELLTMVDGVTMASYQQLQTGMSYDQAVAIIGSPGEEVSRNDIAGISTVMYSWSNPDGSNMNAMFQDSALVQKAQFGLR